MLLTKIMESALVKVEAFFTAHVEGVYMALGIGALLLCWWLIVRSPRKSRKCKWRRYDGGQKPTLRKWTCEKCGADAFSSTRKPPKECKAMLRPRPLWVIPVTPASSPHLPSLRSARLSRGMSGRLIRRTQPQAPRGPFAMAPFSIPLGTTR